jgi:hypothetical protein
MWLSTSTRLTFFKSALRGQGAARRGGRWTDDGPDAGACMRSCNVCRKLHEDLQRKGKMKRIVWHVVKHYSRKTNAL